VPLERKEIENGLLKKGCFVKDNNDHKMFRLVVGNKITGIKTWTSHGSKYKDYSDFLLGAIKKQLRLETKPQLLNLLNCSLSAENYITYLKAKGLKI
jgi:hypothetical protein